MTWHLAGWFVGAIEVWVVLNFMGYPLDYGDAVIIESLMHAVRGAAFAVPGALGAQEGGLIVLCAMFGVPPEAALGAVAGQAHPRSGDRRSRPGRLAGAWRAGIFTAAGPSPTIRMNGRERAMMHDILLVALWLAGACGCLFMLLAAVLMVSARGRSWPAPRAGGDASSSRCTATRSACSKISSRSASRIMPGAVQIVFGVENPNDPAIAVVERLRAAYPGRAIELVVDPRAMGSNPKIANLINMAPRIAHDIVVLADSDIRVPRDYLSRLAGALDRLGGAVTLSVLRHRIGNLWSKLAQLTIDSHFLPGVVAGARLGAVAALPRLDHRAAGARCWRIGGFEPLADCLADDYVLGELVRQRGEPVTVLPFAVGHVCGESSLVELWRHELRWALTIRTVDPLGYFGWGVTHAFPLALIAWALGGGWPAIWPWFGGPGLPRRPDFCHGARIWLAVASLLAHSGA